MGAPKKPRNAPNTPVQVTEVGWPEWVDAIATQRLREVVRGDRIGHAYLLSGPKGVGKAALTRAFAKALCCPNVSVDDRSQPCGVCRLCRNIERASHPDVELFSLESQAMLAEKPGRGATLTIETVRRLRASAALLPLESERRLLIVDDAETLLEPAQQALLKTLEEPPRGVTLVLLADEPEVLLETVRSRCQEIPVRPIAQAAVERALHGKGVELKLAAELATLSRGCAGWALAAVLDERLLAARRTERESAAGWIASPRYEQLVTAFRLGDQFGKRRAEIIGVVQAAIHLLRDEMIESARTSSRMVENQTTNLSTPASMAPSALSLSRAIAATLGCLSDLEANVRPRLALEAMVMAWPSSEPGRN
ncbi:MAG: AAA family ATPase [Chloroflexi bacterium]|nr:AAA family ATPase [Chloroflexota bacterium]